MWVSECRKEVTFYRDTSNALISPLTALVIYTYLGILFHGLGLKSTAASDANQHYALSCWVTQSWHAEHRADVRSAGCRCHYRGRLASNGVVFDSSYEKGRPLSFKVRDVVLNHQTLE